MWNKTKDFKVPISRRIIEIVKRLEGYERENVIGTIKTRDALDRIAKALRLEKKELR